jgi:hypothetical protein
VIDVPMPAPGILADELDDEVCLYRGDTNEVLVLNQAAGDIWRLADGTQSIEEIVATLGGVYAIDESRLRADVTAAVADLAQRGYLVEAAVSGRPLDSTTQSQRHGDAEATAP